MSNRLHQHSLPSAVQCLRSPAGSWAPLVPPPQQQHFCMQAHWELWHLVHDNHQTMHHPQMQHAFSVLITSVQKPVGSRELRTTQQPLSTSVNTPMIEPVCLHSERTAVCWPCRGTDFDDAGDVLVDADCQYTADLGKMFGSKRQIRLHTGFWRAWESVAPTVIPLIEGQLAKVSQLHSEITLLPLIHGSCGYSALTNAMFGRRTCNVL